MTYDYKFRNMGLGEVAGICNSMSAEGYSVDEMYKEGHKMYVLFSKYIPSEEDVVDLSETDEIYEALAGHLTRIVEIEASIELLRPSPQPLEEEQTSE